MSSPKTLPSRRSYVPGQSPAVLSGHGLAVALESLAARAAVPVELDVELSERPPEAVEVAAYYVVSEALANVGKHSSATRAQVRVWDFNQMIMVDVSDDGVGVAEATHGAGLRGLADRVEALGGRFQVGAAAGGGVRVQAEIPCP